MTAPDLSTRPPRPVSEAAPDPQPAPVPDEADEQARDAGMSTAEYAIGTVAACGFAGVLWAVVHSDAVARLLQGVLERALTLAT